MRRLAWAPIVGLLLCCGPAAIAGLVIAVVVDAVDRVASARLPSHISEERRERTTPAGADLYPAPAPKRPILPVLILAAADDVRPTVVFGRAPTLSFFAMSGGSTTGDFALPAATRNRVSRPQVIARNRCGLAAITQAQPPRLPLPAALCAGAHHKSANPVSDQIQGAAHERSIRDRPAPRGPEVQPFLREV